ncbi:hypothetical protein MT325_m450R [Paramecium bursaria chlorella virus MT325]|uniref:Uncharacterized protein m450R n=1 Tax=Paramecium bursaria Chlorella virus MT325 TaxID=346932 RepID=A7IUI0_PBCVM|nr:hypothetical protein MT325_m450R [Paramecium bursaria chlorella virus MT325]
MGDIPLSASSTTLKNGSSSVTPVALATGRPCSSKIAHGSCFTSKRAPMGLFLSYVISYALMCIPSNRARKLLLAWQFDVNCITLYFSF